MINPFSFVNRFKLKKEGKLLKGQLENAAKTGQAMNEALMATIAQKEETLATLDRLKNTDMNLLVPGIAAAGGGLLSAKIISDELGKSRRGPGGVKPSTVPPVPMEMSTYMYNVCRENQANFIFGLGLGLVAAAENTLASAYLGLRNSKLKDKLEIARQANAVKQANIAGQNAVINGAKTQVELEKMLRLRDAGTKLGGVALGTAAVATPAMMYMNNKYPQNPQNNYE